MNLLNREKTIHKGQNKQKGHFVRGEEQVCFVENRLKKLKITYFVDILVESVIPTVLSQLAMVSLVKLLSFGALR